MLDGRNSQAHDRWLAMQSAYVAYRRASDALDSTDQPLEDQRESFERYLEARIEYLETRIDERYRPAQSEVRSWWSFAARKPILAGLAVLMLGTAAFSWVRQQNYVRGLEASHDEFRTTLSQTRDGLEMLAERVDSWQPPQPAQPAPAPIQPVVKRRAPVRKPASATHSKRQPKQFATNRSAVSRSYPDRRRARRTSRLVGP